MNCKICGKEYGINGLRWHLIGSHLRKNEIDEKDLDDIYWSHFFNQYDIENIIKKYINEEYSIGDIAKLYEKDRVFIKRLLLFKGIKLRTHSEAKKTKKYIEKFESTCIEKYGVNNPSKLQKVKDKKKETLMKTHGYINQFCNKDICDYAHSHIDYKKCQATLVKNLMEKYGVSNVSQLPWVSEKISQTWKKKISEQDHFDNYTKEKTFWKNVKFISKIELKIQSQLNEICVSYFSNIWLKGMNVDIYIPNINLIIDIHGDYWHANPDMYLENDYMYKKKGKNIFAIDLWNKDKRKKDKLIKFGYFYEIIWEKEIKESKDLRELIILLLIKYGYFDYEKNEN